MAKYKQKLKCPNCGSRNISLVEEKVFVKITNTNKRTGWLRNKSNICPVPRDTGASWYECNDCNSQSGYYDYYKDNDFIEKEVLDND